MQPEYRLLPLLLGVLGIGMRRGRPSSDDLRHLPAVRVLVVLAVLSTLLLLSSVARAQTYGVYLGEGPNNCPNTPGGWSTYEAAAQAEFSACLAAGQWADEQLIPQYYCYYYGCYTTATLGSCSPSGVPTSAATARCQVTYTGIAGSHDPAPPPIIQNITVFASANNYFMQVGVTRAQTSCSNCVADPINPGVGNVFETETDVRFAGSSAIAYQRFYNSADRSGSDGVPGWRHSYDRSITVLYASVPRLFPGVSGSVTTKYASPSAACTSGFTTIRAAVPAWTGATAAYSNGVCTLSNSTGVVGTLPVLALFQDPPVASASEYDLIRDDGQVLRYPVVSGSISNPPGVSIRLAVTGSGFTVTDDQDNVESYSSAGVLQSITSRSGIVQTIAYDTNALFLSATDSFGNSISVTRNAAGSISQIATSAGGTVQYSYDGSFRLSSVTNLDGTTRGYAYGNSTFTNALTAEIDESGTTYSTWTYNGQEQATATQEAGGAGATTLTYNSSGTVTSTDSLGAARTFSYSRVGDVNKVTGISGSQCSTCQESAATTYDSAGWVSSRTDYNGNLTCYANDPARGLELVRVEGFATGSTCPTGLASYAPASGTLQRKITTQWSSTWREPTLITEPNRTTGFTFDSFGNVQTKTITDTSVTPNVARTWTYTYNSFGQVLTVDGPRTDVADTTTYSYYTCATGYQCGQIQTITDALGHIRTFNTYNAYGLPLTITDPNGVVTTLTYDARQRLTSSEVGTETTGYSYWPIGLLKTVTLADTSTFTYTYDGAHRLTKITDSAGNYISYSLDALGNRTADKTYDPSSTLRRTHTRVFNSLNQLYQDINSASTAAVTTTLGYDSNGNLTSNAAPLARNTASQFDALNRLNQITDPNAGITKLGYDSNDNLASVIDPRNFTTTYTHDGFGEVTQLVSPDTSTSLSTYDSGGNLKTATDARSAVATYSYDALNRVSQAAYSDQVINFTYDAGTNGVGRLTGAYDANHTLSWAYDIRGRVTGKGQTIGSITKSVGYAYTNSDLTSIITPSGQTVTYGYTNHRIASVSVNGTTILSGATYDPFGPANAWTWGNATTVSRAFDEDGNPSQIITAGVTNGYSVDNASRITGISDSGLTTNSWTFGYDLLDRVNSGTSSAIAEGYTYDVNSNRLTTTGAVPSAETIATSSNQLNSTSGGIVRTYSYDNAGNTLSFTGETFTFNQRGRMSSATSSAGTTNYLYNALGQLIEKSGNGGTTLLMYDEAGHILGEYTSAGALIQETIWMGDTPVATLQPNGSGISIYYVHSDHLGTPRKITRPSDNGLMWRWDPDTFGSVNPNTNPSGLGAFNYNLRFPGQYSLNESGLYYNYFRDYDPMMGRYIESDRLGLGGGSPSTYAFVGANPISRFDAEGLALRVVYGGGTQAQWSAALAYLASSAQFTGNLATLIASPYTYTINVNSKGVDDYNWLSRTINWNATSGLNIAGVGVQSPAIGFAHETSHAACHDSIGTKAYLASSKIPTTTQFIDNEIVITMGESPQEQQATLAEQLVSQQLGGGDPARSHYNQPSQAIIVSSPTFHLLYGP